MHPEDYPVRNLCQKLIENKGLDVAALVTFFGTLTYCMGDTQEIDHPT
jgi:hypothetical protein